VDASDRRVASWRTSLASKAAFEATPLVVDGVLYLSTPTSRVIAFDAATGTSRWVYDPELRPHAQLFGGDVAGVALWTDSGKRPGEPAFRLVYVAR